MVERYNFQQIVNNQFRIVNSKLENGKGSSGHIKSGESTGWFGRKITVQTGSNLIELNRGSLIDFLQSNGVQGLDKGLFDGFIGGTGDAELKKAWDDWAKSKTFAIIQPNELPNEQPRLNPRIWDDNPTPLLGKQPPKNPSDLNPRIWDDNPTPLSEPERLALKFRQSEFGKPINNVNEAKQRLNEIATKFRGTFKVEKSKGGSHYPQISFQINDRAQFAALEEALKTGSGNSIQLKMGWQKKVNSLTLTFSESAMLLGHRIERDHDNNEKTARRILDGLLRN